MRTSRSVWGRARARLVVQDVAGRARQARQQRRLQRRELRAVGAHARRQRAALRLQLRALVARDHIEQLLLQALRAGPCGLDCSGAGEARSKEGTQPVELMLRFLGMYAARCC